MASKSIWKFSNYSVRFVIKNSLEFVESLQNNSLQEGDFNGSGGNFIIEKLMDAIEVEVKSIWSNELFNKDSMKE